MLDNVIDYNVIVTVVMKPYMCLLQNGDTVLHEAASNGCHNILQLLLDAGMAVDIKGWLSWNAYICDWLWENPPLTNKDKYLEICNSIIQSVISREGLKLQAYNSLQIYSYLIAIRLPTAQSTAN